MYLLLLEKALLSGQKRRGILGSAQSMCKNVEAGRSGTVDDLQSAEPTGELVWTQVNAALMETVNALRVLEMESTRLENGRNVKDEKKGESKRIF